MGKCRKREFAGKLNIRITLMEAVMFSTEIVY